MTPVTLNVSVSIMPCTKVVFLSKIVEKREVQWVFFQFSSRDGTFCLTSDGYFMLKYRFSVLEVNERTQCVQIIFEANWRQLIF
jgi:hypothetical protein